MISKRHRFKGHKSLDYVYRNGKTFKTGGMGIKASPTRGEDYRLAVVVSKKVHKSAVRRNRIRRRVYEQFRQIRADHDSPIKYDLIVTIFKEDIATTPAAKLAEDCRKLLAGAIGR